MGKLSFDQTDPAFDFPATMPTAICDLIREMTRNKTEQRLQDATHVLTVISQQLSKLPLSKTSKFLPPEPPQPQTPTQEESTEPTKTSRTPLPSATPEPPLTRTPQVQRPKASVDYGQDNSSAKIGIILALILVVGLAGGLGYWYRDTIEPYILSNNTQPENSSGKVVQEQPRLKEKNNSNSPPQDSVNPSKPLVEPPKPVERSIINVQPVNVPKQSIVKPETKRPKQARKSVPKPIQPNIQQSTRAKEAQSNKASVTTKKQSITAPSPAPGLQPRKTIPVAPKIEPPSKTQATITTPIQESPVKPRSTSNTPQEVPVLPAKKQTKANVSSAPIQQEPPQTTPTSGENIPRLSPNSTTTKGRNLQKSPSQPKVENAAPAPSVFPTQKPALPSRSPAPIQKQPTNTTSNVSVPRPLAPLDETKNTPTKNPDSITPANEMVDQGEKSAVATPPSNDTPLEATDAEIEEILQSLDAAKEDLSSIATP